MALLTVSRVILPALVVLGFAGLHLFGESNTLFPQIVELRGKHVLPTHSSWTKTYFPTSFVGYDPPDGLLATLLVFFWPVVDGEHPGMSLLSALFAGQGAALWTVFVLEAMRKGNSGRVIS